MHAGYQVPHTFDMMKHKLKVGAGTYMRLYDLSASLYIPSNMKPKNNLIRFHHDI